MTKTLITVRLTRNSSSTTLIFVLLALAGALAIPAHAQLGPIGGGSSSGSSKVTQWGGVYPASSTSTQVAPYNHAVTAQATGNTGTTFGFVNHWNDLAWFQAGNNYALRQTGLIKSISFSWGNPGPNGNQYTHLYFLICRPSVSNAGWNLTPMDCPVIAKSEDLLTQANAGAGGVVTITLATPIYARKGDFYGFESQGTFNGSASGHADDRFFAEAANCNSTSHCYIGTTVTNTTIQPLANPWTISWTTSSASAALGTDFAIPVAINMAQAPTFALLGDSIIAGSTRSGQQLGTQTNGNTTVATDDQTSDIGWNIRAATGWTYENFGIAGQNTTQIAARVGDITAVHPQFVILEGGVNDVAQSISAATTQANWTTILTAVQAAKVTPVCLLILPWTNGNSTQNGQVDTLNTWLNGKCEQYGGITVDARPFVGRFRTGGVVDNLWDIRPEFMAVNDNLQIHFSTLGYQAIARAVLDRLNVSTGQSTIRKNASFYFKQQTLSAAVASTNIKCVTEYPWFDNQCEAGLYRLSVYASPMTAAATSTVSVNVTYSDTGVPGSTGHSYTITSGSLDLSATTNKLEESHTVVLDGITLPTVSTTYSGTATYQVYVSLERID